MKFRVTRGQKTVCDILILDVDSDKAVGIVKRAQSGLDAQIGDSVTTDM
jgi:hypothetical protein